jgi:hypothetical protein
MFDITAWNINPNQNWYVRVSDGSSGITVELYDTQSDAEDQTNLVASGTSSGFGTDKNVTFTTGTDVVSLFQDTYSWHLKVSGAAADPTKIYLIKQFVDLDDIESPLFSNSDLIPIRAAAEIDAHTHAKIGYNIALGSHITDLECGDVITVQSTRRSFSKTLQVTEVRTSFKASQEGQSLTTSLTATEFLTLKR